MKILVVDDDVAMARELCAFLVRHGHSTHNAGSLGEAVELLRTEAVDLVVTDLFLGQERGSELLAPCEAPVIVISGVGGVPDAVDAVRSGAYDFLEKPIDTERLLSLLRNIQKGLNSERKLRALREDWLEEHAAYAGGSSFEDAIQHARDGGETNLAILLRGPTGSGKDVLARWIHYCSSRAAGPFVSVNCAAIPEELADAAFFGARRGAYTGSSEDRDGWFQAADGGTLFLDEVAELPMATQAKLLRALDSGEAQRVGGTKAERADVRILSATNRDLVADVGAGLFREDLYWRIAQMEIRVPPLAERPEDLVPLARFFLERMCDGALGARPLLGEDAEPWLRARAWPGNARELRSLVERAAWHARRRAAAGTVLVDATALEKAATMEGGLIPGNPVPGAQSRGGPDTSGEMLPLKEAKEEFERGYVRGALERCDGSVAKAAAALGLLPNNLSRKLKELGIKARGT